VESEDINVHRVPIADLPGRIARWREDGFAMDVKLLLLLGAGMLA
jgi:ADP-ribose pyrophosphatase